MSGTRSEFLDAYRAAAWQHGGDRRRRHRMVELSGIPGGSARMNAYTIHIGHRSDEWPAAHPETFPTRGEAQTAVKGLLMHPAALTAGLTKGEVRLNFQLLDCYGRRANSVRHTYEARQRVRSTTE